MRNGSLPDGLDVLRAELSLAEIMRLIAATARWVDPATFRLLPVWYPEHVRGGLQYKENWSKPQPNSDSETGEASHRREVNDWPNRTLRKALGLGMRTEARPNWTCCHIWGVDARANQKSNLVAADARYFSCVANMVLLPTPLKAFTDSMPDVKAMLRICAANLYSWRCDHESVSEAIAVVDGWKEWSAYPASWPRKPGDPPPPGVIALNPTIEANARKRLSEIRRDLHQCGQFYPRDQVRAALAYWKIEP